MLRAINMHMFQQPSYQPSGRFTAEQIATENASFMRKVYSFMGGGLAVTAITSMLVSMSPTVLELVFGNRLVFYGLLFAQLAMVWTFSSVAARATSAVAGAMFFAYALLNGVTMAIIFLVYTRTSIATTFFVTAGTFGAMSAYGYATKRDLTSIGSFAFMGLIGIILASIVNIFLKSTAVGWIVSVLGVLIFVALTAYDTQKIKELNIIGNAGTDEDNKEAIHGALTLYLDFINLFLHLLRFFGSRRD